MRDPVDHYMNTLVPMVVEQTSRGERAYDIFSRLLRQLPRDALRRLDGTLHQALAQLLPEFGVAAPLRDEAQRTRFFNASHGDAHVPIVFECCGDQCLKTWVGKKGAPFERS